MLLPRANLTNAHVAGADVHRHSESEGLHAQPPLLARVAATERAAIELGGGLGQDEV